MFAMCEEGLTWVLDALDMGSADMSSWEMRRERGLLGNIKQGGCGFDGGRRTVIFRLV